MDVHTPKGPIHSLKDFGIELVTIVVGVMIALSFEGLREWNHNRSLASEARETIVRELTDNRNGIDGDIAAIPKRRKDLEQALQFADDLLKSGKTELSSINLGFNYADLSVAGWQTAQHTGALGHMPYADVQRFASAYTLQDLYQTQQRRGFVDLSAAMAVISGGDPTKAPRGDLERFRAQVLNMVSDVFMEEQLAHQLSDRYAKVLKQLQ